MMLIGEITQTPVLGPAIIAAVTFRRDNILFPIEF
jgi:hypothetical protein